MTDPALTRADAASAPLLMASTVRWTTSDRGLRYYEPVDGHDIHESSAAESPHLWINGEHATLEVAAEFRDSCLPGLLRDTLTAAIEGHYQVRRPPQDWKAGDRCELCGSHDTWLVEGIAGCHGCGADENKAAEEAMQR